MGILGLVLSVHGYFLWPFLGQTSIQTGLLELVDFSCPLFCFCSFFVAVRCSILFCSFLLYREVKHRGDRLVRTATANIFVICLIHVEMMPCTLVCLLFGIHLVLFFNKSLSSILFYYYFFHVQFSEVDVKLVFKEVTSKFWRKRIVEV